MESMKLNKYRIRTLFYTPSKEEYENALRVVKTYERRKMKRYLKIKQ